MRNNKYYLLNAIKLAYIGDAVFSLFVREYFLLNSEKTNRDLNKLVNSIVCAKNQAKLLEDIIDDLTEEEKDIVFRARNAHINNKAKNSTLAEYSQATQYEALIGYLYLIKDKKLDKILNKAVEGKI